MKDERSEGVIEVESSEEKNVIFRSLSANPNDLAQRPKFKYASLIRSIKRISLNSYRRDDRRLKLER